MDHDPVGRRHFRVHRYGVLKTLPLAGFFCPATREDFVMDLDKLTMGNGSFGLAMPVLLLLVFTAVAGGIILVLGRSRKTFWTIVIAAAILLVSAYCIFLACHSVVREKKRVMGVTMDSVCCRYGEHLV